MQFSGRFYIYTQEDLEFFQEQMKYIRGYMCKMDTMYTTEGGDYYIEVTVYARVAKETHANTNYVA